MIPAAHFRRCILAARQAGFAHYARSLEHLYQREYPAGNRRSDQSSPAAPALPTAHVRDHRHRLHHPAHC